MRMEKTNKDKQGPDELQVPVWWNPGGGMMYNRDCLPPDHPESTYGYIKNTLGLKPEDCGVRNTSTRARMMEIIQKAVDRARGANGDNSGEWRLACTACLTELTKVVEELEDIVLGRDQEADKERCGW